MQQGPRKGFPQHEHSENVDVTGLNFRPQENRKEYFRALQPTHKENTLTCLKKRQVFSTFKAWQFNQHVLHFLSVAFIDYTYLSRLLKASLSMLLEGGRVKGHMRTRMPTLTPTCSPGMPVTAGKTSTQSVTRHHSKIGLLTF